MTTTPGTPHDPERLKAATALWLLVAVAFAGLGIGTIVAVHHGRRLGAVFLLVGAASAVLSALVRRVAAQTGRATEE